jgi:hypothetical protein
MEDEIRQAAHRPGGRVLLARQKNQKRFEYQTFICASARSGF